MKIIIVGAGIAGLAAALALTALAEKPDIVICELRSQPSSIGGAIGLTPNAQRCLHHLGVLSTIRARALGVEVDKIELFTVYTGARLGQIDFTGSYGHGVGDPPFKGLRIMRADLMAALTETVQQHENIKLEYGCRAVQIVEAEDEVTITLEDGRSMHADLLVGCDGIHSYVRTGLVDQDRKPTYTGIAAVFGFADLKPDTVVPWRDTGLCQSQRGSLMTTYYEPSRAKQFVAAIMETEDVTSREGWLARGSEQEKIRHNVKDRYSGRAVTCLDGIVDDTHHWTLYPVYKLPPKGQWRAKRTMLLGDAAHAMPPQGESAGYALEDAILFARAVQQHQDKGLDQVFAKYEAIRRPRIDRSYDEAAWGWETQKDCGWLTFVLRTWLTTAFLWWTSTARQTRYMEDMMAVDID